MKDLFGKTVHDGDIIALAIRSGNVGQMTLRVVIDAKNRIVKGRGGGRGQLGDGNSNFVKLDTGQLQNKVGYEILDVAFKERQKNESHND